MDRDVDRESLVVESGDQRNEHQMPRRRDRQELRDPLDQRDENQVEEGHVGDRLRDGQ